MQDVQAGQGLQTQELASGQVLCDLGQCTPAASVSGVTSHFFAELEAWRGFKPSLQRGDI